MILRGSPSEEHDSFSCLMNVLVTTHVDHPESLEKRMQLRKTLMFLHGFIASKTTKSVGFCCSAASKGFIWMQALRDWLCAGSSRVQILENKQIICRGESCFSETAGGGQNEMIMSIYHTSVSHL